MEARFASHYPDLDVHVHSAELVQNTGIRIRGLSIKEPNQPPGVPPIVQVDELFISCDATLANLARRDIKATRITVRRPAFRVRQFPDGTWSAARLLPLPRFGDCQPEFVVENGVVEMLHAVDGQIRAMALRNLNLKALQPDSGSTSNRESDQRGFASLVGPPESTCSTVQPAHSSEVVEITGSASADHCRRIHFVGTLDPSMNDWDVGGIVEDLRISPEFVSSLPFRLASDGTSDALVASAVFHGRCSLDFRVRNDPRELRLCLFQAAGRITEGRLHHPRLPRALNDLEATFVLSNAGFSVTHLTARTGQTTLSLNCRGTGFNDRSSLSISGEVRHLELDSELYDCLPDAMKNEWLKFLPRGSIHCDFEGLIAANRFQHLEATIRLLDTSFTYYKTPYRVDHGRGTVTFNNGTFGIGITAMAGTEPVRITGETRLERGVACGRLEIHGNGLIIDEKVLAALPERPQRVIRSMHPQGTFDCSFKFWRDSPDTEPNTHFVVALRRGMIQFERFAYPISGIRGNAEKHPDGRWTFRGFDGQNDTGLISCEGHLVPTPEGSELNLYFTARNLTLEEELRAALPPNMQRLWGYIRPRGGMDIHSLHLRFVSDESSPEIVLVASPHRDTVSIEPLAFPYRLEKLQGAIVYRDGLVTFDRFQARHERTRITGGGQCLFAPDGSWDLELRDMFVDQFQFDRELISALPGSLRQVHSTLGLQGGMNLRGKLRLARESRPEAPLRTNWDFNLGIHQGTMTCAVGANNINGQVHVWGSSDGETLSSRGELAIDSFMYRDVQVTDVRGPIWMDATQLLLGKWVDRRSGAESARTPRSLSGMLFGGRVFADAWVRLGAEPRFGLRATLSEADLHQCATEMIAGRQELSGKIWGNIDLRGAGCTMNSVSGRGQIQLREADIYELPVMISLLKILSIRVPDKTAFSQSDIRFRIEGNHVYFDPIDFKGDAVSLLGKGEMDFQRNVRLTFYPVVGRDELYVPLVQPLLKGASQQVMLVHVDGTLQEPRTTKEAFPGVNQALRELGFDLQDPILNGRRPGEGRQSALSPLFSTERRR